MWLLLNACDVEMEVQAIFRQAPSKVAVGLAKKLQQLDLYEIPSFALQIAEQLTKQSEVAHQPVNDLDWGWIECLSAAELADKLEQSQYIITV